ncbi:MAG: hypothetical protein ABSE47_07455 [Acidimicrobiales bacterium]|jgi:beta-glucanase (GH16 family)
MARRRLRGQDGVASAEAQLDFGGEVDGHRPGRVHTSTVIFVLVLLLTATAAILAATLGSGTAGPKPPPGWHAVFLDRFLGKPGRVDSSWTYAAGTHNSGQGCAGAWGTGEVESDTSATANVSQDGKGHLDITPVRSNASWTSGRIESVAGDFAAPAGGEMEVTASIEQPDPAHGLGYWPGFWMLGAGFRAGGHGTAGTMQCSKWPAVGEIDILEDVNARSDVSGTFHCGTDPGGPCNETVGISSGLAACPRCQQAFNTYSVIVNRTDTKDESITWLLNGTAYFHVHESQVPAATWHAAVDHGFFLILDVAMGGSYPNAVCDCITPSSSTTSAAPMRIAYVGVYTRK